MRETDDTFNRRCAYCEKLITDLEDYLQVRQNPFCFEYWHHECRKEVLIKDFAKQLLGFNSAASALSKLDIEVFGVGSDPWEEDAQLADGIYDIAQWMKRHEAKVVHSARTGVDFNGN